MKPFVKFRMCAETSGYRMKAYGIAREGTLDAWRFIITVGKRVTWKETL